MKILEKHIVGADYQERHVEAFAFANVKIIPSKKGIIKAIRRGQILINDQKVNPKDKLVEGDTLVVASILPSQKKVLANQKLEILFEDDDLIIINKPAGIPVRGNRALTIENIIAQQIDLSQNNAYGRIKAVHRLDIRTSGILLMAKSHRAHQSLAKQFENRTIQKEYLCIVIGKTSAKGLVQTTIENKQAITEFTTVDSYQSVKFKTLSLLKVVPKTGRTNQIRIHLSQLGSPILGDEKFGNKKMQLQGKGLFLHASAIGFRHPVHQNWIHIRLQPPKKFKSYPENQRRFFESIRRKK